MHIENKDVFLERSKRRDGVLENTHIYTLSHTHTCFRTHATLGYPNAHTRTLALPPTENETGLGFCLVRSFVLLNVVVFNMLEKKQLLPLTNEFFF